MSLPPDLRVVCRKLTAAAPADLPALCPVLVGHILRCGAPLSASAEQQSKSKASEAAVLVHKLKTHINTLIHGRTAQTRFAGVLLAKAVVDVGGWECLRTAEPWVRGMLSILQKPDPYASRELCVAVLTRIYTLLQAYPTLVREIATPTVPAFATACLQLLRPAGAGSAAAAAPGAAPRVPLGVVETVTRALAALVPLYPTTLRPFAGQMRAAVRAYVAPTASDHGLVVPAPLRQSARRLLVLLHYTAAKNGNAEEWTRLVRSLLRQAHATADQVFRAVRESRSASGASASDPVSCEGPPAGGGDDDTNNAHGDDLALPAWTGLQSGAERLQGLLLTIAACFACPTKLPVAVPLGAVADLAARLSMVLPPSDRDAAQPSSASASLFNPSIGRDERDELWSMLPAIHGATLELLAGVVRRLGPHVVPLAPDLLDDAARLFAATREAPRARAAAYALLQGLLPRLGPALARPAVDALGAAVHACCADLLAAAGYAESQPQQQQQGQAAQNAAKGGSGARRKPTGLTNADLFLTVAPGGSGAAATTGGAAGAAGGGRGGGIGTAALPSDAPLAASHVRAAEGFLACVLRHVPQQHVKKADRALMDRTAILCASKPAMVASVLQPYVDPSGRAFANTIPFLARAFPHDIELEVLRSNLRTAPHFFGDIFAATAPGEEEEEEEGNEDDAMDEDGNDGDYDREGEQDRSTGGAAIPPRLPNGAQGADGATEPAAAGGFALPAAFAAAPAAPAAPTAAPRVRPERPGTTLASSLKRKSDEVADPGSGSGGGGRGVASKAAKRLDTGKAPASPPAPRPTADEPVPATEEPVPATEEPSPPAALVPPAKEEEDEGGDSGDESDGSVQLEMVFEGEEDGEDDDEEDAEDAEDAEAIETDA